MKTVDDVNYYDFKEYNEFNINGIKESSVRFSTQFFQAVISECPYQDWTPKDPFPSLKQDEIPTMTLRTLGMCFYEYRENIDLTNWDVSEIRVFNHLFTETEARTIDLSTWNVLGNQSIYAKDMFQCPLLEVLDISNLQNEDALQSFFKNAQLPKLQHVFVHDSSMADNLWECLCNAHLYCTNERLSEAQRKGDSEAETYFQYLFNAECEIADIPIAIRNRYLPETKIHIA